MIPSVIHFVAPLLGYAVCAHGAPVASPAIASTCIRWSACPNIPLETVQCANFSVPLDYTNPCGGTTTLALVRLLANTSTPKGNVFVNPGGPGGSGTELALGIALDPAQPANELLRDYNIVGVDPRGVGQSSPVKCNPELWNKRVPTMVQNEAEYTALVEHWKAVGESCKRLTGPLLDHLDTMHVVQDFDRVRQALGDEKFNLVGLSYGTQIGYTYAELFPDKVGRMVLDGVVNHGQSAIDTIQSESTALEVTLQHFLDWCQQESSCALHNQGDVEVFFKKLAAKAQAKPLPAPGCSQTGNSACQPDVSYEELVANVQRGLMSSWAGLADSLLAASQGNATSLSSHYFAAETDSTGAWAGLAVGCQDWDRAGSFAEVQATLHATNRLSPLTLGYTQSLGYAARCIAWPTKPTNTQRALRPGIANAPAVLLANTFWDPSTSVQWAVSMRGQIPNARLVFRNSSGHTSYLARGEMAQAMNGYMLDGLLPPEGTVYQS